MLLRKGVTILILAALVLAMLATPLEIPLRPVKAMALYDSGNPTPEEQLVLEYINRARSNPIAEGQRLGIDIHEGLDNPSLVGPRPPLAMNKMLLSTAYGHSEDMYNQNYFSHNDPNGTTPFQRMEHAGYNFAMAGENMAAGTDNSATELEDFMMVDPSEQGRPHRVNLLDIWPYPCGNPPCIYSEVGVGYYEGATPNSIGNAFITEDFGSTGGGPFLLGVVYDDRNGDSFYDIGEGIAGVTVTPSSGSYYAISSSSGGYAIPIGTSGTITVTASGPGFGPVTKTVTLTGANVKLDFTSQPSSTATTTTSQTFTQTSSTATVQTTTETSSQLTQTSTMFQVSPSNFIDTTTPATITACGSTYSNGQTALGCGSFTATPNLPTPSTGWKFDHWVWSGIACSAGSSDSLSCVTSDSEGYLMAAYAAQVNVVTNPVSSALIAWGDCAGQEYGNGNSLFSTGYGSVGVIACYVPAGYAISGWSCSGGLACSGSNNPTTVTFNGPGTITLNLQPQTTTYTSSTTTSDSSSTTIAVTATTTYPMPEFSLDQATLITILLVLVLGMFRLKRPRNWNRLQNGSAAE